jgi:peroxiredoxin
MEEPLPRPRTPVLPACVAFLLLTLAGGVCLVGRMVTEGRHPAPARVRDDVARLIRDVRPEPPAGSLREVLAHPDRIPSHHHPLLGRQAPDFKLDDLAGKAWNLRDLQADGPVVLVFYHTSCSLCARGLFDADKDLPLFREVGARVAAVSADPPALTRRRFAPHGPFGFTVLSDPGNKVARAYEVFRRTADGQRAGRLLHGTFVIDRGGTVAWVNVGDAPFRRNPALLYQLARTEGRLPPGRPGR